MDNKILNLVFIFKGKGKNVKKIECFEKTKKIMEEKIKHKDIDSIMIGSVPFFITDYDTNSPLPISLLKDSPFYNYILVNQNLMRNTLKKESLFKIPLLSKHIPKNNFAFSSSDSDEIFVYPISIKTKKTNLHINNYILSIKKDIEQQILSVFKEVIYFDNFIGSLILYPDYSIVSEYVLKSISSFNYSKDNNIYKNEVNKILSINNKNYKFHRIYTDNKNIILPCFAQEDFSLLIKDIFKINNIPPEYDKDIILKQISLWKTYYFETLSAKRTLEYMNYSVKFVRGDSNFILDNNLNYLNEDSSYERNISTIIEKECNELRSFVNNIIMFQSKTFLDKKFSKLYFTVDISDENYVNAIYATFLDDNDNIVNVHNFYGDITLDISDIISSSFHFLSKKGCEVFESKNLSFLVDSDSLITIVRNDFLAS